jgi:hypothetical protein
MLVRQTLSQHFHIPRKVDSHPPGHVKKIFMISCFWRVSQVTHMRLLLVLTIKVQPGKDLKGIVGAFQYKPRRRKSANEENARAV